MEVNLLSVPVEILEKIFCVKCLDYRDIYNVSLTCLALNGVCKNTEIWRSLVSERWPDLYNRYKPAYLADIDWKEEFRLAFVCVRSVYQQLQEISQQYYHKSDLPEVAFNELCRSLHHYKRSTWFVMNALRCLLNDENLHKNLTHKYYARLALQFVQHKALTDEWQAFFNQPPNQQLLEKGAVLLAKWFQTSDVILEYMIISQLNDIADLVRDEVKSRDLHFPLDRLHGDSEDVETSLEAGKSRFVLEALNHVLFVKLGYQGNEDDYYNTFNSYINKVMENRVGIPITLSIVYMSVARRLGITCEPVNFPGHFLIKWKEHPDLLRKEQYTFIDVFNKGKFMAQNECVVVSSVSNLIHQSDDSVFQAIEPAKVFERMARNIISIGQHYPSHRNVGEGMEFLRQSVELFCIIKPTDHDNTVFLIRLYLYLGINHMRALDMIEKLKESRPNIGQLRHLEEMVRAKMDEERNTPRPPIEEKRRSGGGAMQFGNVDYAVGMVMHHRRYDYMCVIYGWDIRCTATEDWIHQMGVHLLPNKQYQPFYNVLVSDGSQRYAAQESLEIADEPCVITHPEVGKHFEEFCGVYYKPNSIRQQEYPDDLQYTITQCRQKYGHNCMQTRQN